MTDALVATLEESHRRIRELLVMIGQLPDTAWDADGAQMRERQRLLRALRQELAARGTTEERFLWPSLRRHLSGGAEIARTGLDLKRRAEELLAKLQWYGDRDPRGDDLTRELSSATRRYVDFVNGLFEQVAAQVPDQERERLVARLAQPRRLLPTRPHPDLPTAPWAAAVLGPVVALVDRLRDHGEPMPSGQ